MGAVMNGMAAARRRPPGRRHVLRVQRLHAPAGAAGRASAGQGRLRVDARLGRPRRGRSDPPAGRAARRRCGRSPACRSSARPTPTRRPRRGGGRRPRRARPRSCSAARTSRSCTDGTRRRAAAPRVRARRRRRPQVVLRRHRQRGVAVRRRRRRAGRRRASRAASCRMPSWDLFAAQTADYRDDVLPAGVPVAVGRGRPSPSGGSATPTTSIGIDRFGASAPGRRRARQARHQRRQRRRQRATPRSASRRRSNLMDRLASACTTSSGRARGSTTCKRGYITSGQLRRLRRQAASAASRQPDDLPEGHPGLARLRRAVPRARRPTASPIIDDYWAIVAAPTSTARSTCSPGCTTTATARDGFVSVEVDPGLAHDTAGTERRRPPPARARSTGRT